MEYNIKKELRMALLKITIMVLLFSVSIYFFIILLANINY